MAVVRDFYLENGCHFKINDEELLPEEERKNALCRLEQIVIQDWMSQEAKKTEKCKKIPISDLRIAWESDFYESRKEEGVHER